LELPFISGETARIINEASKQLNMNIPVYGEHPSDPIEFESELVKWRKPFVEKIDFEEMDNATSSNQLQDGELKLDINTLLAYIKELQEPETIMTQLAKILNSAKSNEEIQFEVGTFSTSFNHSLVDRLAWC
jgi:hypothetical protein